MATPRVFVSSTCYDLKYIRENLKYFIRNIGYEPVLSDDGAVFYDPKKHTHDSCLTEVPNCQLFVLIIGGRFGGEFNGKKTSITNEEYREAIKRKIPIFALIEQAVYSDHFVYTSNKNNKELDRSKISYPSIDKNAPKIFEFIDEVRTQAANNALIPFRDFNDIENYLRQQWAGIMFSFLLQENENARMADTMAHLIEINEKVAFLSRELLNSVGTKESNVLASLYELMIERDSVKALLSTGYKPNPIAILSSESFLDCTTTLGRTITISNDKSFVTSSSGQIQKEYLLKMNKDFKELKDEMIKTIESTGISAQDLIKNQASKLDNNAPVRRLGSD
ncbi:DUF4062 domain-containing protein [Pseudomonas tensinigenes]|uniref:DUF4062 domain-containing protein n=1 Tax=Pseudomonas tensinigenes TaxID=2745511 RepID=A0ABX8Q492_9PSED|nr:DUF4062 domain-containing protein [Pseudomonas tensinigenes]QXI08463.1 DUF4062 domain-containing protein [Pseudomonas tensinigenes]